MLFSASLRCAASVRIRALWTNRFWKANAEGGHLLAQIQVRQNESLDSALKRFKKELEQAGVLREAREHQHYEKPSDKKRKAEAARKRKIAQSRRS